VLKTPRTFACSAAAPAKDHRSVLMKGIDRRLHPKILRFSSRFIAGIDSDRRHGRCLQRHKSRGSPASRQRRLVTIIGAYSSTGLSYRIYAPPATRNRADIARAKRAAPSIRAGPSVRPAGVRSDPPANRLDRCRGQARRDLALRRYTPLGILDAGAEPAQYPCAGSLVRAEGGCDGSERAHHGLACGWGGCIGIFGSRCHLCSSSNYHCVSGGEARLALECGRGG
jgi:hypothetical protein